MGTKQCRSRQAESREPPQPQIETNRTRTSQETNPSGVEGEEVRSKEAGLCQEGTSSGSHGDSGLIPGRVPEREGRLGETVPQAEGQVPETGSVVSKGSPQELEIENDGPVASGQMKQQRQQKQSRYPEKLSNSSQSEESQHEAAGKRIKGRQKQGRSRSPEEQAKGKESADAEGPGAIGGEDVSRAYLEAFRRHSGDLITIIQNPEVLAWQLFGHYVISNVVVEEVCMPTLTHIQRKVRLLASVRDQIAVDPAVFGKFLLVLRGHPYLMDIAQRMKQAFEGE